MANELITDEMVEAFRLLDTCCLSDAMDRLGIPCGLLGIKPVNPDSALCGRAFTVRYVPCGTVHGTVGDCLDDVKPGEVVVIDNGGRTYATVWGDLMSITATRMGVGGTVIDGVCRDIPTIHKLGYNIFSKGCYMVTGKDRVEVDAINVPVSVSGVRVAPGDLMVGDATGVVVVPQERAAQVLEVANEIAAKEAKIEENVAKGMTLRQAREQVHYHNLQTREDS